MSIRLGNCNNGANAGGRYVNLNNAAGNANWNIGSAYFYQKRPKNAIMLHLHRRRLKYR